jgi:glycosyltransferase involved in cell wall biosynthesis
VAEPARNRSASNPAHAALADLEARLDEFRAAIAGPRIAVLLPCYNEEAAIGGTVSAFKAALPDADIYVYDNNSTDDTIAMAKAAGAIVRQEPFQGKGNVVRRMFADIDADVYVMADGDMTYDPTAAPALIARLMDGQLDMVVGSRVETATQSYRRGHRLGNRVFNLITTSLFHSHFSDIFSGYRVFSSRFVKSFPASSSGFEIESELTVHALDLKLRTAEVPLPYGKRPPNSVSKLSTYRDGIRILWMLIGMYRMVSPMRFYGAIATVFALASLALGAPIVHTWLETGLVPRFPTAIMAAAIAQLAALMLVCGLIVDSVSDARREMKRMRYLDLSAPNQSDRKFT